MTCATMMTFATLMTCADMMTCATMMTFADMMPCASMMTCADSMACAAVMTSAVLITFAGMRTYDMWHVRKKYIFLYVYHRCNFTKFTSYSVAYWIGYIISVFTLHSFIIMKWFIVGCHRKWNENMIKHNKSLGLNKILQLITVFELGTSPHTHC